MAKNKTANKKGETSGLAPKGLRLLEINAKLGHFKQGETPNNGTQEIQLAIHGVDQKAQLVNAVVSLRFTLAYSAPEAIGPPPLQISAQYLIQYAIVDQTVDQKRLEMFVQQTAATNVWPYWSEVAQSLCIRFGLPPLQMPGPPAPIQGKIPKTKGKALVGPKRNPTP